MQPVEFFVQNIVDVTRTLSVVVVDRINCYAAVEGYGLHSGHVTMSSGVVWSRLRFEVCNGRVVAL